MRQLLNQLWLSKETGQEKIVQQELSETAAARSHEGDVDEGVERARKEIVIHEVIQDSDGLTTQTADERVNVLVDLG